MPRVDDFDTKFRQWQDESNYGDTFVAIRLEPWSGEVHVQASEITKAGGPRDAAMLLFEMCRPLAMSAYRAYVVQLVLGIGMSNMTNEDVDRLLDLAAEEEYRRAVSAETRADELQAKLSEVETRLDELRRIKLRVDDAAAD